MSLEHFPTKNKPVPVGTFQRYFNAADYLDSEHDCRQYLAEFEDDSDELKELAQEDVKRARLKPGFIVN